MISTLTPNTQAILLLTAPLIAGRGGAAADELLTPGEYNRLTRLLREQRHQPADLLGSDAPGILESCRHLLDRARLERLLARGFLLSQAVAQWHERAIWVVSRADPEYPQRLKARLKEDAPPVLYGSGDPDLLEHGGLAVVGSRNVDDELVKYTEDVGRLVAEARLPLVSGAARGIDRASMRGALSAGGVAAGVMADSLERAAVARENRELLQDRRLILASPYDPAAGFNVGNAMQRNKLIYALADAALVVSADFEKGGTWQGAIEQLERFRLVPVFVRDGEGAGKGNRALIQRGGRPWPEPRSGAELAETIHSAVAAIAAETRQELLPLLVREEPSRDDSGKRA